ATVRGLTPVFLLSVLSFSAISFAANTGSSFFFHPTGVNVPSGTFWIGLTFDNNAGATGATDTELDNLGMALFDPPTVGTSTDNAFETTAAGGFLVNNPAGPTFNLGGSPPANFFFGVSVLSFPPITLTPANATNVVGTAHTVCALVVNTTNGVPIADATVTITVTNGPNAGKT